MMRLAIFDPQTGRITSVIEFAEETVGDAVHNIPDGQLAVEVGPDVEPNGWFIDVSSWQDTPAQYPPKPADWAVFDFETREWTDQRSPAELAAVLWMAREAAPPLSRVEFLLAARRARIITEDEARALIGSQIPETLAPLLSGLPESWLFDAEIRFRGAAEFRRMDPLVLIFAGEVALPEGAPPMEAILDMAFGIIPWSADFPPV